MTVDFDTFFCACTNKQGLNPDTKQCGPCKKKEGINSNGICQKCPYGKGIDPETLKCIECPKKYGIDEDTGMCRLCPEKQGINKYSKICQVCKENEGINRITGDCMKCLSGQFIDDDNKCTCSDNNKYVDYSYKCTNCPSDQVLNDDKTGCLYCHDRNLGLDTENMVCVPCTKGQGINYSTKKCEENDDENKCILYYNMRWVSVSSDDLIRNEDTSFCECKTKGHGFISGECFNCRDGYGIDPITYQCRACESNKGEGKDKETGKCRICENTEAISPITGECIDKPEGASKDGYFWSCPSNQYFDSANSRCSDCQDGQYVDLYTLQCTSCSEESKMVDPTTNKCVCKEKYGRHYGECAKCIEYNNMGIDSVSRKCRKCQLSEGIDEETGMCRKINNDEGRDPSTNIIIKCPEGSSSGASIPYCKCKGGMGVDLENKKCVICSEIGMGFDSYDYSCKKCIGSNQFINNGVCSDHCPDIYEYATCR